MIAVCFVVGCLFKMLYVLLICWVYL